MAQNEGTAAHIPGCACNLSSCTHCYLDSFPTLWRAGVFESPATISGAPKYRRINDVEDMLTAQMAPTELTYGFHEHVMHHAANNLGVDPRFFEAFADHPDMGLEEQTALAQAYTKDMWTAEELRRMLASMTITFTEQRELPPRVGDRLPTVFKKAKKQPTMSEAIKSLDGSAMSATEAKTYDALTNSWGPRLDMIMTALHFRASERYHDLDAVKASITDRIDDLEYPETMSADTEAETADKKIELKRLRSVLQMIDNVIVSLRMSDAFVEQIQFGPFKTIQAFAQPNTERDQLGAAHIEQALGAIDPKISMKRHAADVFIEGIGGISSSSSSSAGGGSNSSAKRAKTSSGSKPKGTSGKHFKDQSKKRKHGTQGAQRRIDAAAKTKRRFSGAADNRPPPSSTRPNEKAAGQISKTGQGTNMPGAQSNATKKTARRSSKEQHSSGKGRRPASKGRH